MSISIGENLNPHENDTMFHFQKLLERTKNKLQSCAHVPKKADFWKSFELDVNTAVTESAKDLNLPWEIQYISGHKFPDIVARINKKQAFGIEVKTLSLRNDSWKVMGGSIMESTRIPDVSRIQVFCAKQNPFQIKYRPFEECVSNVAVTHSPRYMLDMELDKEDSLFNKINKSYDSIRQMQNPFDAFKSYLIESKKNAKDSEGEESSLWWYSPEAKEYSNQDFDEQVFAGDLIDSKIHFWNELSQKEKNLLKTTMLIKFPKIIVGDYNNASKWLLQTKGVINPSFRDTYSAGGRENILGVKVPKIIVNIYKWENEIADVLNSCISPNDSFELWKKHISEMIKFSTDEKKVLLKIVSEIGKNVH